MDAAQDSKLPAAIVLKHPSGSTVYLVGTAHVSKQAQEDVVTVIEGVSPSVVMLELDEERFKKLAKAAHSGSHYGLNGQRIRGSWELAKMALTGEILGYAASLVYCIAGAVMGTRPGGEFLAASLAASEVGAQVMLGDRDQDITMKRLMWYSQRLRQQGVHAPEQRRLERMLEAQGRRQHGEAGSSSAPKDSDTAGTATTSSSTSGAASGDVGGLPEFLQREQPGWNRKAEVEELAAAANPDDPWGLGPDDSTERGMHQRLIAMMREGGCEEPEQVLQAAHRIFYNGMSPTGSIAPEDMLTVRACGTRVVESFRQRALKGDDAWMQRLEQEHAAGAKGIAGMERSTAAMRKVIVQERDVILARRLWEASETAQGQPVVGVVGAGHVKGIERWWPQAGTPAVEDRVRQYLQAPQQREGSPVLTAIGAAAVLGMIAYRRPRVALFLFGASALATVPYLSFAVVTMNRFGRFTQKLVSTAETIDEGGADMNSGWSAEGSSGDAFQ